MTAVESFSGIASAQPANITATTATALRHPVYSAIKDPRRCATRLTASVISRCGHCKADLAAAAFWHLATRGVHRYDNLLMSADKAVGLEPDRSKKPAREVRKAMPDENAHWSSRTQAQARRRSASLGPRPFFSRQSPTGPLERSIGSDISTHKRWNAMALPASLDRGPAAEGSCLRIFVERSCHLGLIQHNHDRVATRVAAPVPKMVAAMSWPDEAACVREERCLVAPGCFAPRDETRTPSAGDLNQPYFSHRIVTMERRFAG